MINPSLKLGRAQCIVHRELKILMVQHAQDNNLFWCLPGGGIESGETPAEAAQRELREECQVSGLIQRELSRFTDVYGDTHYTFLAAIDRQEPQLGSDPELATDSQLLRAVAWISLDELAERDRIYLWTAGLLAVEGFFAETERWPRKKAYPLKRVHPLRCIDKYLTYLLGAAYAQSSTRAHRARRPHLPEQQRRQPRPGNRSGIF